MGRPSLQDRIHKEVETIRRELRAETPSDMAAKAVRDALRSPFVDHIANSDVPTKFKMPVFANFDGRTDPVEHIYHVQQRMTLNTDDEGLMCRVFSTTLSGPALLWFKQRPTRSIESFQSLCEQFITQYAGNQRQKKTVSSLFTLRQAKDESLRMFLSRFNMEISLVDNCDAGTAVKAFRVAMNGGTEFYKALLRKPPRDMGALNRKAQGYVAVEDDELRLGRPSSFITIASPSHKHPIAPMDTPRRVMPSPVQPQDRRTRIDKKETPLKVTLSRIFQETVHRGIFRNPPPLTSPVESRDRTKHCAFHKDVGHTTNDCRNLRNQVELLLARGELSEYLTQGVERRPGSRPSAPKAEMPVAPTVKIIDTIHGHAQAWTPGIESRAYHRTPKAHRILSVVRDERVSTDITFHRWDMLNIQTPHEDPLVLSLNIAHCTVRRILVDTGSSANVMTRATLERLGVHDVHLYPTHNPLIGFDGTRVTPYGTILLPIEAAERTLQEVFVIIEVDSPYNVILGRGWIHRMRGVPSTLHQMMKCLSPNGQDTFILHGDQAAARMCYAIALKGKETDESVPKELKDST